MKLYTRSSLFAPRCLIRWGKIHIGSYAQRVLVSLFYINVVTITLNDLERHVSTLCAIFRLVIRTEVYGYWHLGMCCVHWIMSSAGRSVLRFVLFLVFVWLLCPKWGFLVMVWLSLRCWFCLLGGFICRISPWCSYDFSFLCGVSCTVTCVGFVSNMSWTMSKLVLLLFLYEQCHVSRTIKTLIRFDSNLHMTYTGRNTL